jgi:hypothetical protein
LLGGLSVDSAQPAWGDFHDPVTVTFMCHMNFVLYMFSLNNALDASERGRLSTCYLGTGRCRGSGVGAIQIAGNIAD